jgi:hypothetical protein
MADNLIFPKVILKKKQIPVLIDFCLDESIEFSVKQQTFPETDWEIELKLKDFKTAVVVGMFLRESRMELEGVDQSRYKKGPVKKADEKPEPAAKAETPKIEKTEPVAKIEDFQNPTLM